MEKTIYDDYLPRPQDIGEKNRKERKPRSSARRKTPAVPMTEDEIMKEKYVSRGPLMGTPFANLK